MQYVRLENPLRIRLRFQEKRIAMSVNEPQQLIIVKGLDLDGEYQFDAGSSVPALINLSKLSTDEGYREALTPNVVLKAIAVDAELPRAGAPRLARAVTDLTLLLHRRFLRNASFRCDFLCSNFRLRDRRLQDERRRRTDFVRGAFRT